MFFIGNVADLLGLRSELCQAIVGGGSLRLEPFQPAYAVHRGDACATWNAL